MIGRPVARWTASRTSAEVILDFGFWILDWSDKDVRPAGVFDVAGNPKSNIQNPKLPTVPLERRAGSRANLALTTAFSGVVAAGLRPTARGPLPSRTMDW